jgi:low temperature requirement protein LtrA
MSRTSAPRPAQLRTEPVSPTSSTPAPPRVSTLELFFDLVFVFIVTQVTHLVAHAHGASDLLRAFLILAVTWWMYGGYAWLTNNIDLGGSATRLLMLAAMAGFLLMALSIPRVASRDGVAFALALLFVVLVHAALFTRAPNASARAIFRVAPFNVACALLVLAAAFAPSQWNIALWFAALLAPLSSTLARVERGFALSAGHFAERHGLIILIALGESVIGIGAGGEDVPVRLPLAGAAVLGLALAAALWWSYFDRDDTRAEHAMAHSDAPDRARLGVQAYWFAHLLMIAGIVVAAAGVQGVIADLARPGTGEVVWLLAAGVTVYLVGEVAFRHLLRLGPGHVRLVSAGLALATVPVGLEVGSLAQLAVLVGLLVAMLVVERRLVER